MREMSDAETCCLRRSSTPFRREDHSLDVSATRGGGQDDDDDDDDDDDNATPWSRPAAAREGEGGGAATTDTAHFSLLLALFRFRS